MRPFTSTIPFPEALRMALDATVTVTRTEHLPLHSADGRVVAHDVVSPMDVPPFDRSAMGGYAVRCDQAQTGAVRCVGAVYTGEVYPRELQPGECIEIATGAPKPAAPSRNAPNENAINSAWSRWSAERLVTDRFITSSAPASTHTR